MSPLNRPSASLPILLVSTLAVTEPGVAAPDDGAGAPTVLVLRSAETGASTQSYALIVGKTLAVPPVALRTLGIRLDPAETRELLPLSDVSGLSVTLDLTQGEATLSCAITCYATRVINAPASAPLSVSSDPGAFLNLDLTYAAVERARNAAGAFELGVFGRLGQGEASWTVGAHDGAEAVRLETRWTFDDVKRRVRYRVGDSIARAGETGAPFRFGGLQVARDFSLDPRFVTFPTPGLTGVATAPSVVDLYVDGALRISERVDAGPFSITEPPVVSGAGQAQIVVTDALGRRQITSARFYASRALLKSGLSDFSFALGALRESYAGESADYGDVFVSGVYRRGLTSSLTGEVRGEAAHDRGAVGGGLSRLVAQAAQVDAGLAVSAQGANPGALVQFGASRIGRRFSASAEIELASARFARIGDDRIVQRTRGAFSVGASEGRIGSATISAVFADNRNTADVRTFALDLAPGGGGRAALGFTVLYTEADRRALSFGVRLVVPLGEHASAAATAESRDGR